MTKPGIALLLVIAACANRTTPSANPDVVVAEASMRAEGLDTRGGLRRVYRVESNGGEPRTTQVAVVRALRASLLGAGQSAIRVYWLDQEQVVVDVPSMDMATWEQVQARLRAPGLPAKLTLSSESQFGPSVE